jgi:predicted aldo/keto reductase-like oxidoreductase
MEPLRGGKLASLPETETARLKALRPDESTAGWSFRWLQRLPNVKMVLSGMSSPEQMADNVSTFSGGEPLSDEEAALVEEIAEGMKNALPCTRCRYCCDGCPMGLNIPYLLAVYNDYKVNASAIAGMRLDGLDEDKLPSACIGCGQCSHACPQGIDVPAALAELTKLYAEGPHWEETRKQRGKEIRQALNMDE